MTIMHPYLPARFSRIFFPLSVLIPAMLLGQQTFQIRPTQQRVETSGGTILATSVVVENATTRELSFTAGMFLPAGWRPVMRDAGFSLGPGKKDTRILSFSMPSETPAGMYTVRYRLDNALGEQREVAIEIQVLPLKGLILSVLDIPRFVVAGNHYVVSFAVSNGGNVGGRVLLSIRNSDDFLSRLDSAWVFLGPRESRTVRAIIQTSGSLPGKIVNTTALFARLADDSTVSARVSGVTDVIPQVAEVSDRYLEVPIQAALRMDGEDDRLGGQIELIGSGSLREDRTDRLDVMVRTPDIQSQSSLAQRDEYRLRYQTELGEVRFGDWSYSLSPLTELNRYAFGAAGAFRFAGVTAGGYVNRSRFFTPHQQQTAGYLQYEIQKGYQVALNFLRKMELEESRVSTVRSILEPLHLGTVDIEYGVSNASGRRDEAFAAQIQSRQDWGSLDIRKISAGPQYSGYYRDIDYLSAAATLSPIQGIRLEAYYRKERKNKGLDTTLVYAPQEEFLQIGAGFSNLVSLYYRSGQHADQFPVAQFRRKEDVAQLQLGFTAGKVNLYSNIDMGISTDKLTGKHYPSRRYALFSGFSPSSMQNYNTSFEYSTDQDLLTAEKRDRVSIGLGGTWFLTNATSLLTTVFWSRTTGGASKQDFALIDFTLQHIFPFQHRIGVRARQTFNGIPIAPSEVAYQLEYRVPLALPVKRLTASGQVRGTVSDENGKGIANVLVNIGSSASISDIDGDFFFPSLSPGQHYLTIDKASIGLDRVAMQQMPLPLSIVGGEEIKLPLRIVRGSRVSGTVTLFDFDEGDTTRTVETGPRAGVHVELDNGVEVHRRVSDNKGRFAFADLRPGDWKLSVTGGAVPEYHSADQASLGFALAPGRSEEVSFRILPRARTIRIIQKGEASQVTVKADSVSASKGGNCFIYPDGNQRGYILQVSSWETRSKAAERARVAEEVTGKKASIERAEVPGLGLRFRVNVGPFKSQIEAEIYCKKLRALESE